MFCRESYIRRQVVLVLFLCLQSPQAMFACSSVTTHTHTTIYYCANVAACVPCAYAADASIMRDRGRSGSAVASTVQQTNYASFSKPITMMSKLLMLLLLCPTVVDAVTACLPFVAVVILSCHTCGPLGAGLGNFQTSKYTTC